MRWKTQELSTPSTDALPGLARLNNLVRTVTTPEFSGVTFHEVLAKSALNRVPGNNELFGWTINPIRGCGHACTYCFARPTHRYLDLDAGDDFDSQLIVKVNIAEVLHREVHRSSWSRAPVALGTNTDPYQRAEGRYSLMPGIIDALASSGTPFSILTKGTLLRRDIPAMVAANAVVPVDVAMSVAIFDDDLQRSVEPGTPSARARLSTVTAVREAGLPCSVFLMPILPFLTDTRAHLDEALRLVKESGATSVLYSTLYLKPGTREWFMAWLGREYPHLVQKYEALYSQGAYAPVDYLRWLDERIRPMIRHHRLERGSEDPITGGPRSRARGVGVPSHRGVRMTAAPRAPVAATDSATLF